MPLVYLLVYFYENFSLESISAFSNITIHPDHHNDTKTPVSGLQCMCVLIFSQGFFLQFAQILDAKCSWEHFKPHSKLFTFNVLFASKVSLVYIHCIFLQNLKHLRQFFWCAIISDFRQILTIKKTNKTAKSSTPQK